MLVSYARAALRTKRRGLYDCWSSWLKALARLAQPATLGSIQVFTVCKKSVYFNLAPFPSLGFHVHRYRQAKPVGGRSGRCPPPSLGAKRSFRRPFERPSMKLSRLTT